jgi:arylsulfatase A-like enzyme
VEAATVSDLGSALDMVATAAALAGLKEHPGVDGYDLTPLLRQSGPGPRDVMPYYARGKLRALRKGRYKIHLLGADNGEPLETPRLYDLHTDLSEQNDVSAANPQKLNELLAVAAALRDSIAVHEPIFDLRLHQGSGAE